MTPPVPSGIRGLSEERRTPRIGKVRLGVRELNKKPCRSHTRSGGELSCDRCTHPVMTDHFVFPNDAAVRQLAAMFGDSCIELPVAFPSDDPADFARRNLEMWGPGTLKCRGNGETMRQAARLVGLHPQTPANWIRRGKREPESPWGAFAEAVDLARRAWQRTAAEEGHLEIEVPPQSADELNDWFDENCGVRLPSKVMTDGHIAPLEAAWKLFTCEWTDVIVLGSRTGGKTLLLALLIVAKLRFFPKFDVVHYGAVQIQSRRMYRHYEGITQRRAARPGREHLQDDEHLAERLLPGDPRRDDGEHAGPAPALHQLRRARQRRESRTVRPRLGSASGLRPRARRTYSRRRLARAIHRR